MCVERRATIGVAVDCLNGISVALLLVGDEIWREKVVFFFQAEDGIRDYKVTGVQTCALPIYRLEQDQVLVSLARTQAQDFEWAGRKQAGELGGGPCDERARPHEVAVRAVRAERQPGPHGQGEPVEELLRQAPRVRSEEHTSELQSPCNLVCRLLLEK